MKTVILAVLLLLAVTLVSAKPEAQACEVKSSLKEYEGKITDEFKSHVCTKFGPFEAGCDAFVDKYGKEVIELLAAKLDPEAICEKVGLCQDTTWFKECFGYDQAVELMKQMQKDQDQFCDICLLVVGEAEKYINQSEPEIEKALVKACGYLPPSLEGLCDTIVLMYGHQLVEYLLKYENATIVCNQIGLCHDRKTQEKLPEITIPKVLAEGESNAPTCDLCVFLTNLVEESVLSDKSEKELQTLLDNACQLLPTQYSSQCVNIVDEYLPYLIYYIKEKFPPQAVCTYLGLCHEKEKQQPATPQEQNGVQCSICKWIIGEVENIVQKNTTEQKIEEALHKVCDRVPGSYKDTCNQLVTQYAKVIIDMLIQKASPEQVCKAIGLCDSQKVVTPLKQNGVQCSICKWIIGEVENIVQKNTTEQKIEEALHKVCDRVPGSYKDTCNQLVTQYAKVIIDMIIKQASPEQVCKAIGLCDSQKVVTPLKQNGPGCSICQWIITEVENIVQKNTTEQKIEEALHKVCDRIPGSFKDTCNQVVTQYAKVIIDMIIKQASPDQICKAIGLCDSQKVAPKAKSGEYCELCIQVATFLEDNIKKNSTTQHIIDALEKVCDYVPDQYKAQCKALLPFVWQDIVKKLLDKETPEVLCKQLTFCTNEQVLKPKASLSVCDGCKHLVSILDNYITLNTTEQEIIKYVEQACDFFPDSYKGLCKLVVEQYGKELIEVLAQKILEPETVCKTVHACPKFSTQDILEMHGFKIKVN